MSKMDFTLPVSEDLQKQVLAMDFQPGFTHMLSGAAMEGKTNALMSIAKHLGVDTLYIGEDDHISIKDKILAVGLKSSFYYSTTSDIGPNLKYEYSDVKLILIDEPMYGAKALSAWVSALEECFDNPIIVFTTQIARSK